MEAAFATGKFDTVVSVAKDYFHQHDLVDREFVTTLALTQQQFYDNVLKSDAALYAFMGEVDGRRVLSRLGGVFPRSVPRERRENAQFVPLLSKSTVDYISGRGMTISRERADDRIRPTVRDLIAVVGDKPVTAYGNDEREAFKRVLLALPANWNKTRELRSLSIVKASSILPFLNGANSLATRRPNTTGSMSRRSASATRNSCSSSRSGSTATPCSSIDLYTLLLRGHGICQLVDRGRIGDLACQELFALRPRGAPEPTGVRTW